jgi:hypothetical protein
MDNGRETSASAWIADMGEQGDFGRRYVLEPIMLPRALARAPWFLVMEWVKPA